MDTDSLFLPLSDHDSYDCIQSATKKEWNSFQSGDCTNEFSANSPTGFSLVLAALSIRSTIDENMGYSKKNSAAQNWFVCVAKNIIVTGLNQISSSLAATAWMKELLKTVVMFLCPNIARFWKTILMQRQQVEIFAQYNMVMPHMIKQRRDCHTFIRKETFSKIEYALVPLKFKY